MTQATEVQAGERFEFGRNWSAFLSRVDEERIARAESSLREMLGVDSLAGARFLDIGCGSGLFSLAARNLGAVVRSFDYDPRSVACAAELRRRYRPDDPEWRIEEGSVLDREYVLSLGEHDVVYSWGVLHHTGQMHRALDNAALPVRVGGRLFIAIYNDCGAESLKWRRIKRRYNRLPTGVRPVYAAAVMAPYEARDAVGSLLRGEWGEYLDKWTRYSRQRGMSRWHDIVDWVGGLPYEFAGADELVAFFAERGFEPERVVRAGGLGCNELILRRTHAS